jgi:predicted RNA binding protein YcfA (HicA-like mRNA interferase family)
MTLGAKDCEELRRAITSKATNYRHADLKRWLTQAGFQKASGKGDHEVWRHPSGRRVGLVARPGNILPAYVKETARRILEVGACPE